MKINLSCHPCESRDPDLQAGSINANLDPVSSTG